MNIKPKDKSGKENLYNAIDLVRVANKKRKPYGDGIKKEYIQTKADYSRIVFHYLNTSERRRYVLAKELKLPLIQVNDVLDDYLSLNEEEVFEVYESKMNYES